MDHFYAKYAHCSYPNVIPIMCHVRMKWYVRVISPVPLLNTIIACITNAAEKPGVQRIQPIYPFIPKTRRYRECKVVKRSDMLVIRTNLFQSNRFNAALMGRTISSYQSTPLFREGILYHSASKSFPTFESFQKITFSLIENPGSYNMIHIGIPYPQQKSPGPEPQKC